MPNAFAPQPPQEWQSVASELKDLLNADEYASARASTPNAHYTSPEVVNGIWRAMEQFGLQAGAHILEPSIRTTRTETPTSEADALAICNSCQLLFANRPPSLAPFRF
jgi:hypothetical protein